MKTLRIIFLSAFVNLIVIGLIGVYLYGHRSSIFNSFIAPYLSKNQSLSAPASPNDKNSPIVQEESSVEDVVAEVNPAVVAIVASKDVPVIEQYFDNSPFNDFFGLPLPQYRQNGTQKKEVSSGSGFFVSAEGLLVTNKHVVADTAAEYTIITTDNKKYIAKVLARDPYLDVAVLKIEAKNLPFINMGTSRSLKLGQRVIAIGNALGQFRNSVSVGVISGLSRSITAGTGAGQSELLEQVIQTDAAINPGNSGGPLIDLRGQAVGVNVAVASGSENIGFALPIDMVKTAVDSVAKTGQIVRPYIGIRFVQIDQNLKEKNNLAVDYGALITRGAGPDELAVIPGSPADKAGLLENDIILSIDGKKLDGQESLSYIIRQKKIGDIVTLKILSKGQEKQVKLTLEKAPN